MPTAITTNAVDVASALRTIAAKYPREFGRALYNVAKSLKAQSRRIVRTGTSSKIGVSFPVATLSPLSKALRKRKLGGVLATSVVAYATRKGAFVGWPDALGKWVDDFQTAETRVWDKAEKHRLYQRLGSKRKRMLAAADELMMDTGDAAAGAKAKRKAQRVFDAGMKALIGSRYNRPARVIWDNIASDPSVGAYVADVAKRSAESLHRKAAWKVKK